MKKKVLISLMFIVTVIGIYYISIDDNNDIIKTISYNGNNLRISIDGEVSNTLPTSGTYYLVDYDCKSSNTKLEWDKNTYKLNIFNGTKKGGITCNLEFKSKPFLSEMEQGSYVSYEGNNNCDKTDVNGWTSCGGKNANYVSDTDMGYCIDNSFDFTVNGWRLAYVENGSPHLISAGATDCMCTSSNGISSNSSCSDRLTSSTLYKHFENMNAIALKYCNKDFAKGGICDVTTSWAMKADKKTETDTRETSDFKKITGSALSSSSCYGSNIQNRFACGYTNDLIDNGGYYWIATAYSAAPGSPFYWSPYDRIVSSRYSNSLFGVRSVLALESSIIVVGGDGTYKRPYLISNNSFKINEGSEYISANDDKSNVQLSLIGIGIDKMCISVDTSVCNDYISYSDTYTLDWSNEADGEKNVYVYYKDSDDNIVASLQQSIILDTTAPTNNSVVINDGLKLTRVLTISSTDASSMCFSNTSSNASDCTNWIDYSSSTSWRLTDGIGSKTVYAFFKDNVGNISSFTATTNVTSIASFEVNEDFSDTTYDSNITITGGATYPWSVVNSRFESTCQNVNSGNSSSTIQIIPTFDCKMSFDYGVSSEQNFDKLTITLTGSDGSSNTIANAISGTTTGSATDIELTAGVTYTLTLSYKKDGSVNKNADIGYIDNLIIQ